MSITIFALTALLTVLFFSTALYLRAKRRQLRLRELYQRKFSVSVKQALKKECLHEESMKILEIMIKTLSSSSAPAFLIFAIRKHKDTAPSKNVKNMENDMQIMGPIMSYWILSVSYRHVLTGLFVRSEVSKLLDDANKTRLKENVTDYYQDFLSKGAAHI